jgi:hypothetical protein
MICHKIALNIKDKEKEDSQLLVSKVYIIA